MNLLQSLQWNWNWIIVEECLLKDKWNNLCFLFLKMGLLFNVIMFLPATAFLSSLQSALSLWLIENSVKYNIFSTSLFIDVVWCQAGHCGCDSLKLFLNCNSGIVISLNTGNLCFPVCYLCFFPHLSSPYISLDLVADASWHFKKWIIRCIKICSTNSRI